MSAGGGEGRGGQESPAGRQKGSGLQKMHVGQVLGPSQTSPWSSPPAQSLTGLWGKGQAVCLQGEKEGKKMNQHSRKGTYFLFCNSAGGTHSTCLPRSICTRKQKFSGSLGTCRPAATCSKAVTASETRASASCCISLPPPPKKRQPTNELLAGGRQLFTQIYYLKDI